MTSNGAAPTSWRNRIVRSGSAALSEITANPANWRTHPKSQADALGGVLSEVGYVQQVIINERSGRLVDGHLRVALAEQHGEASVPAVWVDLDDDEERLILATLDPLAAMAETDAGALAALLESVSVGDDALAAMLVRLEQSAGLLEPVDPMAEWVGMPAFDQPDQMPHRTVYVHFTDDASVGDFAHLIGQQLTDRTKYVWYPEQERRAPGAQYVSDEP